jgi:hypothetical protein
LYEAHRLCLRIYITDFCVQCGRAAGPRLHSLRLWSSGPARIHGIYACDRFASHGACKWTSTPVRVEIKLVILHIHKVHVRGYMSGTCCRETGKPSPYSRKNSAVTSMRPKEREPPGGQAQLDGLGTHSVSDERGGHEKLGNRTFSFQPHFESEDQLSVDCQECDL